ncbi:hypothetical protein [Nocardia nova]|nr:hypothetical protein [Nocardia nova]
MSDLTTIKVSKVIRDRLQRVAASKGVTLAQAIDQLLDTAASQPKPTIGGYRSDRPLSAEEIDQRLGQGFGV